MSSSTTSDPPAVTCSETVDELVAKSQRKNSFPLRRTFVQGRDAKAVATGGPIARLVSAGDRRALVLFLLLVTKASSEPWNSALPSAAWARALGEDLPDSKSARTMISKAWLRLERQQLVRRERRDRMADVYLLTEDGCGAPYAPPGDGEQVDPYFRVPLALWTEGPAGSDLRWHQVLTLPELVVLLIARSLGDGFLLPQEKAPVWYSISADTAGRGLRGLVERELLEVAVTYKKTPLSRVGYTEENRYTLKPPFGPVGYRSGSGTSRSKAKPAKETKSPTKSVSTKRKLKVKRKRPSD